MKIAAKCITSETEDGAATLGFADDKHETTTYVLIQRDLEPSTQDIALGHDKPYLEVDDQKHSGYGAIKSVTLAGNGLTLYLFPEGAKRLSVDGIIEVSFKVSKKKWAQIREQLEFILKSQDINITIEL